MTRVVLTYREYAALPGDGRRYEIHDGELSVTPAPGTTHQIFVANDRQSLVSERGIEGAPTLVVEILSPSTIRIDRVTKLQLYARYGVPFYWLIDSEAHALEAYELGAQEYSVALRASGSDAIAPPPFDDLALVPASLFS